MKKLLLISLVLLLSACTNSQKPTMKKLDLQGHRGCRGLLPENTIPAFMKALELGVTTLELDVVVSKDRKLVVSHEPWMSPEICKDTMGNPIPEADTPALNIFQMEYRDIAKCDCGSMPHPRFPDQENMATFKPLLTDVIEAAETWCKENGVSPVRYNIETKSSPERDSIYLPLPGDFSDMLMSVIIGSGIQERATVQSFDVRTLQHIHEVYPDQELVLLVENDLSAQENLDKLGFIPEVYSPYYKLVDEALVTFCKQKDMLLIPWTVNEVEDMQRLVNMGVDGLISDFPDRFSQLQDE